MFGRQKNEQPKMEGLGGSDILCCALMALACVTSVQTHRKWESRSTDSAC